MTSRPPVRIDYTADFKRDLKQLYKKYRNISHDLQTLIEQLESGGTPDDQVSGIKHPVYKVRVKSTDQSKGKRGGYRVLYYIKTIDLVVLVAIYAKSQKVDLSRDLIQRIIEEFENRSPE